MKIQIVGNQLKGKALLTYLQDAFTEYDFIHVFDYNSAFERWKSDAPIIVIIVADNSTNDACNLIRKIRNEKDVEYTYIVTVSEESNRQERMDYLKIGVDEHIVLPLDYEEIALRLNVAERIISITRKKPLLYTLSKLLSLRNIDAGKQYYGVASYCRIIANEMKKDVKFSTTITDRFIDDLVSFSMIHDIGKIGIDDTILKNPAMFTFDEREIMKQHTKIGANFIQDITINYPELKMISPATDIIRAHHECFDGSGYPDGLKGCDIPLMARIVALADVYDALVEKRVYREALSHKKAMHIIRDEEASHFDPDVLKAFLNCESEIRKVKLLKKDSNHIFTPK